MIGSKIRDGRSVYHSKRYIKEKRDMKTCMTPTRAVQRKCSRRLLFLWTIYASVTAVAANDDPVQSEDSWSRVGGGGWVVQPCRPHDSCLNRCVRNSMSTETSTNITLGYLNCFCDPDCQHFGDCCWDYVEQCGQLAGSSTKPKDNVDKTTTTHNDGKFHATVDSFECIIVDEISKGSYWMVTSCASDWPDDATKQRCVEIDNDDLLSNLPVVGETGWTYRNAFCASCNHVDDYRFWTIVGRCDRTAPEEMLSGDPDMMSYYLQHFCSVELQLSTMLDGQSPHDTMKTTSSSSSSSSVVESNLSRKSLRPCQRDLIRKCPRDYGNRHVSQLCEDYQSIVMAADKKHLVFKNPFCALCHGYHTKADEIEKPTKHLPAEVTEDSLACPIWLRSSYYDRSYWTLSSASISRKLLPAFNSENYQTSRWIPPSFSVLMKFRDGESEVVYEDSSGSSVTVPAAESCHSGQIYDPFYGTCRDVLCTNNMIYTEDGKCAMKSEPTHHETTPTSSSSDDVKKECSVAGTVTVTIEVPTPAGDKTAHSDFSHIKEEISAAFHRCFNFTVSNATIVAKTPRVQPSNETSQDVDTNDDGKLTLTMSLVILEKDNSYNDSAITEFVKSVATLIDFEKILIESDHNSVVVVESAIPRFLQCRNGTERMQYNSSDFEFVTTQNGTTFLHINETNANYAEGEYQFIDWEIMVSSEGVTSHYQENSRVIACAQTQRNECASYVPLNESEFMMMENGSVWLFDRNVTIDSDDYITHEDTIAVCIDDHLESDADDDSTSATFNWASYVISWIAFVFTVISLIALAFTFLVYCLFSELRTIAGCNIMNLVLALFAALLTFLVGASWTDDASACTAITMLLHYLFLSTFFWNNVMAFDVWVTFGQGFNRTFTRSQLHRSSVTRNNSSLIRRTCAKYMAYAWGSPLLLVAVCAACEFGIPRLQFGYQFDPDELPVCWISNPIANLVAFGVPLAIILIVNGVFFVISIAAIRRTTSRCTSTNQQSRKSSLTNQKCTRKTHMSEKGRKASDCPAMKKSRTESVTSTSSYRTTTGGIARVNVFLYIKMSTVMGFTWAVGFAAAIANDPVLWHMFELSVPLQGLFIFVAFVCKRRVYKLLARVASRSRKGKSPDRAKTPQKLDAGRRQAVVSPPDNRLQIGTEDRRQRVWSTSSCDSSSFDVNVREKSACKRSPHIDISNGHDNLAYDVAPDATTMTSSSSRTASESSFFDARL